MALPGRFQVIRLTDAAAVRVREIVANAGGATAGIRIGVKNGGCAGMEYTVKLAEEAAKGDDVVDLGTAKVFVDPAATLFLLGTEMDYEETKLRSGFVFNNPNQVSACGCGESVTLRAADPSALQAQQA
ncbi:Fe-S cluster assembly scaffold SufA [Propylenella binzhouense]|uniref:Fe-S cluster assembly scaffold SufA n=1 Tax=Propylenella binzhouense TaxID=2555902 RepID=A0A964T2T3_9HYPH|nr:Fe-S cluster assembly scaffold SufA [Propylenella binzhouense]MYZ47200.1 Fe-S cluster assembly scaffold SufA [Propylenella binzhouense]